MTLTRIITMIAITAFLAVTSGAWAFSEDFAGTPDLTSAPWTTVATATPTTHSPHVVSGPGSNPSNVLHVQGGASTDDRLRLALPAPSQFTQGTIEFDLYLPSPNTYEDGKSGRTYLDLRGPTGYIHSRSQISYGWGTPSDINTCLSFTGCGDTANSATVRDAWVPWQISWDDTAKEISYLVNGADPFGGPVAYTEATGPNGPVASIDFFPNTNGSALFDNIVVRAGVIDLSGFIPEPATLSLLGMGGMTLLRRRR